MKISNFSVPFGDLDPIDPTSLLLMLKAPPPSGATLLTLNSRCLEALEHSDRKCC